MSVLFGAIGLSLVAVFAISSFSSPDAPAAAPVVRSFSVQPEHIYDQPVFEPTPAPTPQPTPEPTPTPQPAGPPLGDQGRFTLVIPDIGVEAPVNPYGLDANQAPEVPFNGYEVAWYNWSAHPGTGSNAVFAGHVTWSGAGVFYNLEKLQSGDEIVIRNDSGAELQYRVEDNFLVDPDDPDALSLMGPTSDDTVTIITCGGDYYYSSSAQFGAEYTERRVVRASFSELIPAPENAVSAGSES